MDFTRRDIMKRGKKKKWNASICGNCYVRGSYINGKPTKKNWRDRCIAHDTLVAIKSEINTIELFYAIITRIVSLHN